MEKLQFQVNDIYKNQKIIAYSSFGLGIVKIDGFSIFVDKVILDEIVDIKLTEVKKKYAFGEVISIIKKSKNRRTPKCPYYDICNGCNFLHMDYEEQLRFKLNQLKESFSRSKLISKEKIEKIEFKGGSTEYKYRNKVTMYFFQENQKIKLGYHKNNQLIDIQSCLLQDDEMNQLTKKFLKFLNKDTFKAYDKLKNEGLLKSYVIRKIANKYMIIVVSSKFSVHLISILKSFYDASENIKSINLSINSQKNSFILSNDLVNVVGELSMVEKINGKSYDISPTAFFQINNEQAEILYETILNSTNFTNKIILDAYCGTGTIGLYLANIIKYGIGLEINEKAVENARKNQKLNRIDNFKFISQDLEEGFSDNINSIDIIIVDPPRKGLNEKMTSQIKKYLVKR